MPLSLYDTMTRDVREVFPMDENSVRFYACGPTVYGPHIGNFRTLSCKALSTVLKLLDKKPFASQSHRG